MVPALRPDAETPLHPERRTAARHVWVGAAAYDRVTPEQALERIGRANLGMPFRYVTMPDADAVRAAEEAGGRIQRLYAGSWLTLCPSPLLARLAARADAPFRAQRRVELVRMMFETVVKPDDRITVVGGDGAMITALINRYGLKRVSWMTPRMGRAHTPAAAYECARFIAHNPARFTFLAVGAESEERIAAAAQAGGDCVGVGICVGGDTLDVISGVERDRIAWGKSWNPLPSNDTFADLRDARAAWDLWRAGRRDAARVRRLAKRLAKAARTAKADAEKRLAEG